MVCQRVQLPDGGTAIVCGPRQRKRKCKCGRPADLLCDWKVPTKRSGTCDAPVCDRCAVSPAPEKDLCAKHGVEFEAWKAARTAKGNEHG